MNNKNEWEKTLLNSLRHLPRFCESIDKLVRNEAVNSKNYNPFNIYVSEIGCVSKKMISLMDRKVQYINLKVRIQNALNDMNENMSKILILKYVYRHTNDELCKLCGVSLRTMFRRIDCALMQFKINLIKSGFDSESFEKLYSADGWLKEIHYKVSKTSAEVKIIPTKRNEEKKCADMLG